jgi:hypothetical protein
MDEKSFHQKLQDQSTQAESADPLKSVLDDIDVAARISNPPRTSVGEYRFTNQLIHNSVVIYVKKANID